MKGSQRRVANNFRFVKSHLQTTIPHLCVSCLLATDRFARLLLIFARKDVRIIELSDWNERDGKGRDTTGTWINRAGSHLSGRFRSTLKDQITHVHWWGKVRSTFFFYEDVARALFDLLVWLHFCCFTLRAGYGMEGWKDFLDSASSSSLLTATRHKIVIVVSSFLQHAGRHGWAWGQGWIWRRHTIFVPHARKHGCCRDLE